MAETVKGPQPGERTSAAGLILPPERNGNIRGTIEFKNLEQRSTKYNSPGVDPENPYNAFAPAAAEAWVGDTTEQEATPENLETAEAQTEVLEHLVAENDKLRAEVDELKRIVANLAPTEKELAEKQPRRVRSENGITERLVKYADGTFEWQPVSENTSEPESDLEVGDEKPKETSEDKVEKKDTGMEIKVGDRVRYTDRNSNVIEGVLESTTDLDNENYVIYHVRTDDGELKPVSYAELTQIAAVVGGEDKPGEKPGIDKLDDIISPDDDKGEKPEKPEGGKLDFGNYPELYAQRKNLLSTKEGQEKLEVEGKRVAESISNEVWELVQDFIEHNPEATEERINQAMMGFYVMVENSLQREIIDHIDGKKVDGQEAKGLKGILRKFGAFMDKHGSKIKTGLLIAGGVGLAATGVGVVAAGGAVGFALGAGTAIGAAKGAAVGGILTRHGSKNSASRKANLESEPAKEVMANLDPSNRETFDAVANWLMEQKNEAAKLDNAANKKKTAIGAGIGAVAGAIAGSLEVTTPTSEAGTIEKAVPGEAPELISHQIAPGELTGQVLDKLMVDSGINLGEVLQANNITGYGDSFTMPDGSTNIGLIHAVENALGANFGEIGQTHSFAGADALSDPGIRSVAEALSSNAVGEVMVDVPVQVNGTEVNEPLTNLARVSAFVTGSGIAKMVADRVAQNRKAPERVQAT